MANTGDKIFVKSIFLNQNGNGSVPVDGLTTDGRSNLYINNQLVGTSANSVWTQSDSNVYYADGFVGIANSNPQDTLSVGSNLQVSDTGSNVLVVSGLQTTELLGYCY